MDSFMKGELDSAFDDGRLRRLPTDVLERVRSDPEASEHLSLLMALECGLGSVDDAQVAVPDGFREAVLRRLPARSPRAVRSTGLHDLLLFGYFVVLAVFTFLFRDILGITALLNLVSTQVSTGGEFQPEVIFSVLSSVGILAISWILISSFFGIRSRRTTK